jgi:hypothetical protein
MLAHSSVLVLRHTGEEQEAITIKPERHLELRVERRGVGRWGLTLGVGHACIE